MTKNRWFKFFPSDFLTGIRNLTPIEVTAYIIVICELYDHEGSIKRNDSEMASACRIRQPDFTRAVDSLIAKGKISEFSGYLGNKRVSEEIERRTSASADKARRRSGAVVNGTRSEREETRNPSNINGPKPHVRPYIDIRNKNKDSYTLEGSALHPPSADRPINPAVEQFIRRAAIRGRSA